ncbi:MAG TPA: 2-amino-4-hydroxy-6-hydroxymethyldihydropteridine diphosphokinase [Crocinitomix sp.]|nr:2-amino-4-hydroxy-6-hydroxymethyldihydropteridine diphosphokinase [Crocinitomix sp.]
MKDSHTVYIAVGTNLGDKYKNIETAYKLIQSLVGNIISKSHIYCSEPWGFSSNDDFLNSVIEIHTKLSPLELLNKLQHIENKMGRKQKTSKLYESRIIDLDILSYDDLVINSKELTLPHPYIEKRNFVYIPLREICPNWVNPITSLRLDDIKKDLNIKKYPKKNI